MSNSETFKDFIRNYWDYYRQLEDELLETRRYVNFSKDNFATYSIEFLKLYQAVCSEIDVIGKSLASICDETFCPDDKKNNIYKWWYAIQNMTVIDKDLYASENVRLSAYVCTFLDSFELKPWDNFQIEKYYATNNQHRYRIQKGCTLPGWWKDYNTVKHGRTYFTKGESGVINYRKANLGNLINAFAALYILELAYMELLGTKDDLEAFADFSKLFEKIEGITSSEITALFEKSSEKSLSNDGKEELLIIN